MPQPARLPPTCVTWARAASITSSPAPVRWPCSDSTRRHPRALVGIFVLIIIIPVVFNLPALVYTGLWFLLQIMGGLADLGAGSGAGGIAWWAHIGGFIAGLILIDAFGDRYDRHRTATGERPRTLEFGPQRSSMAEIDWAALRNRGRPWGAYGRETTQQPSSRAPDQQSYWA